MLLNTTHYLKNSALFCCILELSPKLIPFHLKLFEHPNG